MLLSGKRVLVTGVLTDQSIAFSVARCAQEQGAEIVLTSFGRAMSLTRRVARRLPVEPHAGPPPGCVGSQMLETNQSRFPSPS